MPKLPAPGSLIRMPPSVTTFSYISPFSFKDRRHDLVLILAIETVKRSMSDLKRTTLTRRKTNLETKRKTKKARPRTTIDA